MQTYETLRAAVYEILYPNGIPLEFGCEVSVYIPEFGEQNESTNSEYSPEEANIATFIEEGEPMTFLHGNHIYDVYSSDFKNGSNEYIDDEDGIVCEVIGKPLQLADILRAIETKCKEIERVHGTNEAVYDMQMESICYIDLSKPMQDQEESVLLKLIELIK